MELNEIGRKIVQVSGNEKEVAEMLKEIFMYQRSSSGNYKNKYRDIIEKYAKVEDKE